MIMIFIKMNHVQIHKIRVKKKKILKEKHTTFMDRGVLLDFGHGLHY